MNVQTKIKVERVKVKMRQSWCELKDVILLMMLLNALIGYFQQLDF